jgi:hypothetical protein
LLAKFDSGENGGDSEEDGEGDFQKSEVGEAGGPEGVGVFGEGGNSNCQTICKESPGRLG